jgi:hypothetical protein
VSKKIESAALESTAFAHQFTPLAFPPEPDSSSGSIILATI